MHCMLFLVEHNKRSEEGEEGDEEGMKNEWKMREYEKWGNKKNAGICKWRFTVPKFVTQAIKPLFLYVVSHTTIVRGIMGQKETSERRTKLEVNIICWENNRLHEVILFLHILIHLSLFALNILSYCCVWNNIQKEWFVTLITLRFP
jgi:hypothetical protein